MTNILDLTTLVVAGLLSVAMAHLFLMAFGYRKSVTFGGIIAWPLYLFPFLVLADLIVRAAS